MPSLKHAFTVKVKADKPIVIGQDGVAGRRQLIPCPSGEFLGDDGLHGTLMPGCIDSQVIRPNGRCDLSARYGIMLDDGRSFYIENNGFRTVPKEYVEKVVNGEFIDPDLYYFATTPTFEVYHESLNFLYEKLYVCVATRKPDAVMINYYTVEKD